MEFSEKTIKISIDEEKCEGCETHACVEACKTYARGILILKDGKPMVEEVIDKKFQLTLIKHKRIGWFCLHCKSPGSKWSVPFPSGGDKTDWIEHWFCGDTRFFLRDCFIKQNDCDKVVETFVKDGGKTKSVSWKPLSQIKPHVEQPPENASRVVRISN